MRLCILVLCALQLVLGGTKPQYNPHPQLVNHLARPTQRVIINLSSYTRNSERLKFAKTPVAPSNFERRKVDGVWRSLPKNGLKTKNAVLKPRASAVPVALGNILVTAADGSSSYISSNLNPDGSLALGPISSALSVTLPSSCPISPFTISNIGASIDSTRPLSNANPSSKRSLTAQQLVDLLTAQVIAARQQLVVDQIKFDEVSAYNNIVQAAQAAFDAIAFVRDGNTAVADRSAPTLAADQTALTAYLAASATAGTAQYQQLYTACVAAKLQRTTAQTAYLATLSNPLDASSIEVAAAAARLAISTAALAAQGLDPDGPSGISCATQFNEVRLGQTGPQSTAFLNSISLSITADRIALALLEKNLLDAQNSVNRAPNSARLIPGSGGITFGCSNQQLSATYINFDGSTVAPVTFFTSNNAVLLTGNYASYSSANTAGSLVTLTLVTR